jgi:hypothetical protein
MTGTARFAAAVCVLGGPAGCTGPATRPASRPTAFVLELPAGTLTPREARRHASIVLAIAKRS